MQYRRTMGAESCGDNHNDQYSWMDQLHTVLQPGNGGVDAQIKQQGGTGKYGCNSLDRK